MTTLTNWKRFDSNDCVLRKTSFNGTAHMCHKCGTLAWLTRAEYCRGPLGLTNIGKETASRWYRTIHLGEEIMYKLLCQKPDHEQRGIFIRNVAAQTNNIYISLMIFFFTLSLVFYGPLNPLKVG